MSDAVTINNVYPWGRNKEEYMRMFDLSDDHRGWPILDCGGGPSSFNAEATAEGWKVTTVDPLYEFTGDQIRKRVEDTRELLIDKVQKEKHRFTWGIIGSPQGMGELRMRATTRFLEDFDSGLADGRYLKEALPVLSFDDDQFQLAVVSHFLFLYENMGLEFHIQSLIELARVAREVRVFPLLNLEGETSPFLLPVWHYFLSEDYGVSLHPVDYQVQKGGSIMLRLTRHNLA
jgi:hypothetical protein